jgi:putative phosphoesterase
MKIGIVSDSHGEAARTVRAVELLWQLGAARLYHCGDVGGDAVLEALAGHSATLVWGNCDDPTPLLARYAASLGIVCHIPPRSIRIDGRSIGLFHGHESSFASAAEGGAFDYLLHGHTHRPADRRVGRCRVINPGALHRARVHTAALLDLGSDALGFWNVDDGRRYEPDRWGDRL